MYATVQVSSDKNSIKLFVNNTQLSVLSKTSTIVIKTTTNRYKLKNTPRIFGGYFSLTKETILFDNGTAVSYDDYQLFLSQLIFGGLLVSVDTGPILMIDNSKIREIPPPEPIEGYYMPFIEIEVYAENITIGLVDVFAQLPDFYQSEFTFNISENNSFC